MIDSWLTWAGIKDTEDDISPFYVHFRLDFVDITTNRAQK